ncbi:MAG TPA: ABC-F family ATP-binding cassette domain-containing protein [Flavitalea sp.]|nr:ABC-F family ATP-binding cassette domain-containing protein [Flavitalea sp.]
MLAGFTNVTFEFGARIIVEDATWHIQPNERIGLIGYNGTGKSTLLKVLVGEYLPSAGSVERGRNTSIGYLHQDLLSFDTNDSIFQVALGAFEKILQLEKEIDVLGKQIEAASAAGLKGDEEKLVHDYTDKLHDLEMSGGYNIHHQTEEVLQGLGFPNTDLQRPYREFSGGWRMRVLLAKMILQQPDLLLLDEPTNHLDLPSIEWLEKYLLHYKGSVVIVSHDKYFLNRMVTKIVELYQRQLHIYNGNFDHYETEKEQRVELQQRAYENQQEFIRQQERFIERFRAKASKAAAAQSAMKRLDKLERIEDVEIERPNIRINFKLDTIPGKTLVTLKDITKRYGAQTIVENASAEINRGDKIALIGANGKGKSTLLRIIAGDETFEGQKIDGHNVVDSFYAQHQLEALDVNNDVLEEVKTASSQQTDQELRTLLGCFLFSGDDVEKKVKVLSGGEKARVALAKTMISRANFLLLDEPTNHLDMHSCDLLIEALNKYQGTILLVSHDRFFIARTANKIWEIDDYKIREFIGTYDEWADWKERSLKAQNEMKEGKAKSNSPKNTVAPQQNQPITASINKSINKESKKELQRYQRDFQQLEEKMGFVTKEKAGFEHALSTPEVYSDRKKFAETEAAYKKSSEMLASLTLQYEKLFEKIVELENSNK